ncbi:Maf family protein [Metallibacterium sp.]|uniref:Maf family protein n=1 Tax=Metallibacterium sp. TaxID=2940281 RepID=UPI00260FECBD|nr:Maf family protein [Metallibacterium sp.]
MNPAPRLLLASRSPRRRELLARLGCAFEVIDVEVPEQRHAGETPAEYVQRVAHDKAAAGWGRVRGPQPALVLGADTEVVLDDTVFGKPAHAAAALDMLQRLSGHEHEVLSALCLLGAGGARTALVRSTVRFAPLDAETLHAYVASGEPFGKAGAYAIQGYAESFVARLAGSYSGVMGLPLHATASLLRAAGVALGPPSTTPRE